MWISASFVGACSHIWPRQPVEVPPLALSPADGLTVGRGWYVDNCSISLLGAEWTAGTSSPPGLGPGMHCPQDVVCPAVTARRPLAASRLAATVWLWASRGLSTAVSTALSTALTSAAPVQRRHSALLGPVS